MKFISLEAQVARKNRQYQDVYQEIEESFRTSAFAVFYKLRNFNSLGHDEVNQQVFNSFKKSVENKIPDNIQEKSFVFDVTNYTDGAAGGIGEFESVFRSLEFWVGVSVVFAIQNVFAGGLQEIGKDVYSWIKSEVNKFRFGRKKNLLVFIRTEKNIFVFQFYDYFDVKTFDSAWKRMSAYPFNRIQLKKGERGYFVFDTRKNKWQLTY